MAGRPRLSGIRARTTVGATVVTALALALGGVLLLTLLSRSLRQNLDATVETQATDRAQLLDTGADPASLTSTRHDASIVWLGRADGRQLAAGGAYQLDAPLPDLTPGGARTAVVRLTESKPNGATEVEEAEITYAVTAASDGRLALVGAELESVDKPVAEVRNLLLGGLPILLAAIAVLTWRTSARTLRPVDEITTTATAIGAGPIDRRVAVPETGDEVEALARTVNGMLDRIDAGRLAQRRFTADASHELKSPVANLHVLAETAPISDEGWPPVRDRILGETERLAHIVDDLLFLSVADEAGQPFTSTQVHLDDILFDEAELVAATTGLTVDISGVGPCDVLGDRAQLRRLIRNLVDNAARFARSMVVLATATSPAGALVTVADDGPGIPVHQREAIFERFGRTDAARDRARGGTGLGLAIVRTIAERHGGQVEVSETAGGGATFTVRLPTGSPPDVA